MNVLTKFHLRYVSTDVSRHYPPNWFNAVEVQLIADTTEEAKTKLFNIIGEPSPGKEWRVSVDKIIQQPGEKDYWGPLVDDFPY